MATVVGRVSNPDEIGVVGESAQFEGVRGISHAGNHGGVVGINDNLSDAAGPGVFGTSTKGEGVRGVSQSPVHGGVVGTCDNEAAGVFGESTRGEGVRGVSHSPVHGGVVGTCDNEGAGVFGESTRGAGVRGISHSPEHGGVAGFSDHAAGIGVFGQGGRLAGLFEGGVKITGDLEATKGTVTCKDLILANEDCAEDFDVAGAQPIAPGSVMVIGEDGALRQSERAYDKRVAGVIAGAGDYRPAITLGKRQSRDSRMPVSLVGKVYCRVDAQYSPIVVGDLLTTSPTPGHAMRADDPFRAFGAVIGKSLQPLKAGQGIIPILVALQ